MTDDIHNVDDLHYDWPPNIVSYDVRYLLGLTTNDLLALGMGLVGAGALHLFLAPLGGLAGLLLVKRFAALGDRRAWEYLFSLALHRLRPRPVTLPRVLPVTDTSYAITDLDGVTLAELQGE